MKNEYYYPQEVVAEYEVLEILNSPPNPEDINLIPWPPKEIDMNGRLNEFGIVDLGQYLQSVRIDNKLRIQASKTFDGFNLYLKIDKSKNIAKFIASTKFLKMEPLFYVIDSSFFDEVIIK